MKTHKHTTRRPARLGITSQRSQITGYLAGAVGTAALLGAPQAEAAVTAVNFGFGPEYNFADGSNVGWTVGPGFGTIQTSVGLTDLSLFRTYHNASFDGYHGLAVFFANGTVIGNGLNGARSRAFFQFDGLPIVDFTSDQVNKNIAFKTNSDNWGWANVSWTEATKTLAINSAFVESVANAPITITVGAVPEPSRALLALAGLGGVALRRRRKLAA